MTHIHGVIVVYYESKKRELKIRLMNEGRYDERLKARWVSTRSRYYGRPTDTQTDTQNRSPRQDVTDLMVRYCSTRCILETKTKVGRIVVKVPDPRTYPNIDEDPTVLLFIINR
jgi:hypothetical protein